MVAVVCAEYCFEIAGLSIDRRKIDLLDYVHVLSCAVCVALLDRLELTAYAIRSPLGSEERGVG